MMDAHPQKESGDGEQRCDGAGGGETPAPARGRAATALEEVLWLEHQQNPDVPAQSLRGWRLTGELQPGRLLSALETALRLSPRLDVRYRFDMDRGLRVVPGTGGAGAVHLHVVDSPAEALEWLLRARCWPFDPDREVPLRFLLCVRRDTEAYLGAVVHRLLESSLSWPRFFEQVTACYPGEPRRLAPAQPSGAHAQGILPEVAGGMQRTPVAAHLPWLLHGPDTAGIRRLGNDPLALPDLDAGTSPGSCVQAELSAQLCARFADQLQDEAARVLLWGRLFADFLIGFAGLAGVQLCVPARWGEEAGTLPAGAFRCLRIAADDGPLAERLARMHEQLRLERPRPPEEIASGTADGLGCVLVCWQEDPGVSLSLSGVRVQRLALATGQSPFELALAVGPGDGDGLLLELTGSAQVSAAALSFLLERWLAFLSGSQADAGSRVVTEGPVFAPMDGARHTVAASGSAQAGADTVEPIILAEFRAALDAPEMGPEDDFFDFGGHSLVATRVIGRLLGEHGIEVHINDLFRAPTARALASHALCQSVPAGTLASHGAGAGQSADLVAPLSLAQQSLWKIYTAFGRGNLFNIPFALRFLDPVDEEVFGRAFADVLERHTGLRTLFREDEGAVRQQVVPLGDLASFRWFWRTRDGEVAEDWREALAREAGHDFDLSRELPLRIRFVGRDESGQQILSLLFHHIVLDEWSVNLLMDELEYAYRHRLAHEVPLWAELPAPFHEFARAQRESGMDQAHLGYWLEQLRGAPRGAPLFGDTVPVESREEAASAGGWVECVLAGEVVEGLYRLARENHASLFNVVYSAIAAALHRLGAPADLLIGTSASGRNDPRFFDTIGYFTTVVIHRIRFPAGLSLAGLIEQVRTTINGSMEYTDIPIDLVEEALSADSSPQREHLFEVFIQLHARNKLNGALRLFDGERVEFRQIDPQKDESLLGLQFEVMEETIDGVRSMRVLMSYRAAHYNPAQVGCIRAAVESACACFARAGDGTVRLAALLGEIEPPSGLAPLRPAMAEVSAE